MYKSAPLPFAGQKRMFLKHFEAVLHAQLPGDGEGWTIIDAFGGSGLLSHTAKALKPRARVIYNDFDGYSAQLKHIDDINALREKLLDIVGDYPREKRITAELKQRIIDEIERFQGFKGVHILCAWLLFSGNQVGTLQELYKKDFWHHIRRSEIPRADGWFNGFVTVNESFHTLLPRFANNPKALFVLDPPYLCTRQESYKQEGYFDLIDFLTLINITRPPYIFFSSTKSEFVRFIEWTTENKQLNWQAFSDVSRLTVSASASYNGKYEDNLVYKF